MTLNTGIPDKSGYYLIYFINSLIRYEVWRLEVENKKVFRSDGVPSGCIDENFWDDVEWKLIEESNDDDFCDERKCDKCDNKLVWRKIAPTDPPYFMGFLDSQERKVKASMISFCCDMRYVSSIQKTITITAYERDSILYNTCRAE